MKKICNYAFQLVSIYVIVLTLFSIFDVNETKDNYNSKIQNVNQEKTLLSSIIQSQNPTAAPTEEVVEEKIEEQKVEPKEETTVKVNEQTNITTEVVSEPIQEPEPVVEEKKEEKKVNEVVNIIDTSSYPVISSEVVTVSRYGHDCQGCEGGQTAAGYWVGDGRLYYNDSTFGSLRIVAADKKYPLGTVIRITHNGNSFGAIVLDRGGGLGDHARFQIDLLDESEAAANSKGVMHDATLEVLRLGY